MISLNYQNIIEFETGVKSAHIYSNTDGPGRQNQNNCNVENTDEEDRTETFQTPNARVATDTKSENKEKSTLRKGFTRTTQDTFIKYNLANKPKKGRLLKIRFSGSHIVFMLFIEIEILELDSRREIYFFSISINNIISIWPPENFKF